MVSTRKRSYPSTSTDQSNGSGDIAGQPIVKKPKPAIAESNKRKRNISNIYSVSGGSEVKMNSINGNGNLENDTVEPMSKRPKIATNKNVSTSSSSSSSTTPTIIEENIYTKKRIQNALLKDFKNYVADPSTSKSCPENRSMAVECHHSCEKYGVCKNRFISNNSGLKEEKDIELFHTVEKGYGIRAIVPIQKGTFIGDYNGEVINEAEKNRRHRKKEKMGSKTFYMMKLENYFIDAEYFGSKMRYLNHSCEPNCETKIYLGADGLPHVCLFSIKNIAAGEELTFKYSPNKSRQNEQQFECYCGAKNFKHFFTA